MSPHRRSRFLSARSVKARKLGLQKLEPRYLLTVPAFSSLPGADHTIFLDFDGESVESTSWNSYYNQTSLVAQPYDIDGNPSSFNATELQRIEESWKRTAEDFRPFNINVTTVDPGSEALRKSGTSDSQWGVRVIVTNESTMVTNSAERCGCGGIAYIDSFNWSSDTPVWVYTTGGKSVAEAASHEVGHSLGLSHDGLTSGTTYYRGHGDGETGWASIMGVGYYENVTQWDRGEYYNANNGGSNANYGDGPDDLALIVGQAGPGNGFGYRADDHGDSSATATSLTLSGTSVSGDGVIETTSDLDVFRFTTGAGNVSLSIDPFTPGPNLDVRAELLDSSGNSVAVSDSSSVLSAGFNLSLAAGTYYLEVDGTGWGNPGANPPQGYSDYASLGMYTISGSIVDSGDEPVVSVESVTVNESDGLASLALTLSKPATTTTSVNWATSNGSAVAPEDYLGASGTVTFAPGETQSTIQVSIVNDTATESQESFSVSLSNPTGLLLGSSEGLVTIVDDDIPLPSVSISDASVQEGKENTKGKNAGTRQQVDMVFTVSLSSASGVPVTVDYATQDDLAASADMRASAGDDYVEIVSGQLLFAAGETSKTVTVTVLGDNTVENDETFLVALASPVNATISDSVGIGSILNDDSSGGGGGGGRGGGNGGGKPKKGSGEGLRHSELFPVAIVDELWMFEGPEGAHSHHHHHEHSHAHVHDHHDHDSHGPCGCDSCLGFVEAQTHRPAEQLHESASEETSRDLDNGPTQAQMAAALLWDLAAKDVVAESLDFESSREEYQDIPGDPERGVEIPKSSQVSVSLGALLENADEVIEEREDEDSPFVQPNDIQEEALESPWAI